MEAKVSRLNPFLFFIWVFFPLFVLLFWLMSYFDTISSIYCSILF